MVIKIKPLDDELTELRQLLDEADESIDIAKMVKASRGYWLGQCKEYSFEELDGYSDLMGRHHVAYCNGVRYWFGEWLHQQKGTAELIDSPKVASVIGEFAQRMLE